MGSKVFRGDTGSFTQLRDGLAAVLGKSAKLMIQGKEVKTSEILDSLDALIANDEATATAREEHSAAVAAQRALIAQERPMLSALRAQLRGMFSEKQLAACGLTAKQPNRVLSTDERIAVTVKLRATREANGTRGPRQVRVGKAKAAIKAAFAEPAPSPAAPPEKPPTVP